MERILKINGKPKIFDISQTCAHFSAQQHSRLQKPTSKNWLLISWSHHLYIIEDLRWQLNLELNTDTNFLCHLILLCGKISRDIILSPLALALFCRSQVTSHHTSCPGFLAPKAVPFHLVPWQPQESTRVMSRLWLGHGWIIIDPCRGLMLTGVHSGGAGRCTALSVLQWTLGSFYSSTTGTYSVQTDTLPESRNITFKTNQNQSFGLSNVSCAENRKHKKSLHFT